MLHTPISIFLANLEKNGITLIHSIHSYFSQSHSANWGWLLLYWLFLGVGGVHNLREKRPVPLSEQLGVSIRFTNSGAHRLEITDGPSEAMGLAPVTSLLICAELKSG